MPRKKLPLPLILLVLIAANAAAESDAGWRKVRSAAGRFSVDFPCKPVVEAKTVRSGAAALFKTITNVQVRTDSFSFHTPTIRTWARPTKTGSMCRDSMLQGASGSLISEKAVRLASRHPGREFDFTAVISAGELFFRTRVFLVRPRRIYSLMVGSSRERWSESDASKFLLSFTVSK